ncbi:MAG: hypothetical protein HRU20_10915 [Pseudomonadales bacterium]|nr:hypothetical protein [Pseudomonadales bacterium]
MRSLIRLIFTMKDGKTVSHEYLIKGKILHIGNQHSDELCFHDQGIRENFAQIELINDALQLKTQGGDNKSICSITTSDAQVLIPGLSLKRFIPPAAFHIGLEIHRDINITGWPLPRYNEDKKIQLKQLKYSKARWALYSSLAVFIICLVLPLLSFWMSADSSHKNLSVAPFSTTPLIDANPPPAFDRLWQTGPLHQAHQFAASQCSDCHTQLFTPVDNATCLSCHQKLRHHMPPDMRTLTPYATASCILCHKEHNEPNTLMNKNKAFCVVCHSNAAALSGFIDGSTLAEKGRVQRPLITSLASHSLFYQKDAPSDLIFSHKKHLQKKGLKTEKGYQTLSCENCHNREKSSDKNLKAINFDLHCSDCHQQAIRHQGVTVELPHKTLAIVNDRLQVALNSDKKTRAQLGQELLTDKHCLQCHKTQTNNTQALALENLHFNSWPTQRFSHKKHQLTQCQSCHENVEHSTEAETLMMPNKAQCLTCHNEDGEQDKIPLHCSHCHKFHNPVYQARYETDVLKQIWPIKDQEDQSRKE